MVVGWWLDGAPDSREGGLVPGLVHPAKISRNFSRGDGLNPPMGASTRWRFEQDTSMGEGEDKCVVGFSVYWWVDPLFRA